MSNSLVLSAGMPRSGSTLLYNMLRLLLIEKYGEALQYGWETPFESNGDEIKLIKTHTLSLNYIQNASRIFYTFRDPRVALVSHSKLFPRQLSLEDVDEWILQYYIAREQNATCFQYEKWIPDRKKEMLQRVAFILCVSINVDCIYEKLEEIRPPDGPALEYSTVTLLFPNHFTGTDDNEWRDLLPVDLQKEISKKYSSFLMANNYPLE